MQLQGTIKKLTDNQTFASGFTKREMILLTEEQYPQPISIEFLQDKVDLLNHCKEGDIVKVGINIRGREWISPQGDTKYFNSIVGWRVEKVYASSATPTPAPAPTDSSVVDDDDDLPY